MLAGKVKARLFTLMFPKYFTSFRLCHRMLFLKFWYDCRLLCNRNRLWFFSHCRNTDHLQNQRVSWDAEPSCCSAGGVCIWAASDLQVASRLCVWAPGLERGGGQDALQSAREGSTAVLLSMGRTSGRRDPAGCHRCDGKLGWARGTWLPGFAQQRKAQDVL